MSDRPAPPPRVRSALFVPTHQRRFLASLERLACDAAILDLEDSIVSASRGDARRNVSEWLSERSAASGPAVFARVNQLSADQLDADLDAVVHPALRAVLLPKVRAAGEIARLAEALAWHEGRRGMPRGSIRIWPLIETAEALEALSQIASAHERVAFLGGAVAPEGDLARSLGFEVSDEGLETLYLRSQVLVAARAAGVHNPVTGLYTGLDDLEGFERFARRSRALGYDGIMVIHPSHIAIANAVFSPDPDAVAAAQSLLDALEAARLNGDGAVRHEGRMIDTAMAESAARVIAEGAADSSFPAP